MGDEMKMRLAVQFSSVPLLAMAAAEYAELLSHALNGAVILLVVALSVIHNPLVVALNKPEN